jgi:glyoxylase I family protein
MASETTRRIFLGAVGAVGAAGAAAATPAEEPDLERVTGIGGLFFRANDPKALTKWYSDHLGINLVPTSYSGRPWRQEAGACAFQPFPEKTTYFGDDTKRWMVNFRVRSLDKMAAQLRTAGIKVDIDQKTYPNGRFARLHDPEGNPIELWEPGAE